MLSRLLGKLKRGPSRDSGAEPPGKRLKMSMPIPKEKSGLFILHDRKIAVAEWVFIMLLVHRFF